MAEDISSSEAYENTHVHEVYDQIATHFSSTRYKPWPIIGKFLTSLPPGSVGLDVGCGNGKYLAVHNPGIFILGSDRSRELVKIAKQHQPHEVVVADCLALPHVVGGVDFVVCVAVVHHLSTTERRREALRELLETLKAGQGRALIYVWALEQEGSRRGWKEGGEQDVMVPWVMKGKKKGGDEDGKGREDQVFQRYYHLYAKGELERDIESAGGEVMEGGYEKDNWWAIATRRPP